MSNSYQPAFATSTLAPFQTERLLSVMKERFEIHGVGNFPTLHIRLQDLIPEVVRRIPNDIGPKEVKINGGLASHILSDTHLPYNDVDLIFTLDLCSEPSMGFEVVKTAVLDSLLEFFPFGAQKSKLSRAALQNSYIRKLVKVTDGDVWSLISLNNNTGRFVELKFVDRMRRQFEFSVDSFQIHLDSVLQLSKAREQRAAKSGVKLEASTDTASASCVLQPCQEVQGSTTKAAGSDTASLQGHTGPGLGAPGTTAPLALPVCLSWENESLLSDSGRGESDYEEELESSSMSHRSVSPAISDRFFDASSPEFMSLSGARAASRGESSRSEPEPDALLPATLPIVVAESHYGDFKTAMFHLNNRLIDTKRPEEIRGGGLLKYCKLLAVGYQAASPRMMRQAERYMCSRFFIDFPDVAEQYQKLDAYLSTHFSRDDDPGLTHDFLTILYRVVSGSTVCLMSHERQMTLKMLQNMTRQIANQITRPAAVLSAAHSCAYSNQADVTGHGKPRHTILYLSHNGSYWLPLTTSYPSPAIGNPPF